MLPLAQRLFDTLPALHRAQPLSPALPYILEVTSLALLRYPGPTFEVIEDPETVGPRSNHDVNQAEFFSEEEGALWVHLTCEFFEVVEELGLPVFQAIIALVLKEAVVGWDDSRADVYRC